jgi:hypothetical protein
MNFTNILRVFGPRLIGVLAGYGATRISEQTGVAVDPAALIAIGTVVYSGAHRVVSSIVNKGDAATGRVAHAENTAADTGTTVKVAPKI